MNTLQNKKTQLVVSVLLSLVLLLQQIVWQIIVFKEDLGIILLGFL